jgi:hypothetical protein
VQWACYIKRIDNCPILTVSAVIAEGGNLCKRENSCGAVRLPIITRFLDDKPELRNRTENNARPTFFGDMQQGIELW